MRETKSLTARDVQEEYAARARKWFAGHVATLTTYDDGLQRINWRDPQQGNTYWIEYLLDGCDLFVTGDVGSAVYRWSRPAGAFVDFLGGLELEYFASKRECMEGAANHGWEPRLAEAEIRRYFEDPENADALSVLDKTRDSVDDLVALAASRDTWSYFLSSGAGAQVFGDEWWECWPGIGDMLLLRIVAHWVGITMAVAQLSPPS